MGRWKPYYLCVRHHHRGPEICANDLRITQDVLDEAVLGPIRRVFDPGMIRDAVARAVDQLQTSHRLLPDQRRALERELADCDARLRHLVDAVGTGKATEAVFADLQKYEARKKAVTEQLDRADRLSQLSSVDAKRIERQLTERAGDITQLLGQHIPHTRQILRKLIPDEVLEGKRLPGRLICTPIEDARGRGYTFFARGSYSRLLGTGVAVNDGGGGHGS